MTRELLLTKLHGLRVKGFQVPMAWMMRRLWRQTKVVALTGSGGKTTATHLLAHVLSAKAPTQHCWVSRNSYRGVTDAIILTNPWKHRFCVLEIGAHQTRGHVPRLAALAKPEVGIALIVCDELSGLGSTQDIADEKAGLIRHIRRGGAAFLNGDDPLVRNMPVPLGVRRILYGTTPDCEVHADDIAAPFPDGLRFRVSAFGRTGEIQTSLRGLHWLPHALSTVGVALYFDLSMQDIAEQMARFKPYPGRMQPFRMPNGAVVVRDEYKRFNFNLDVSLEALGQAKAKRKLLFFGDFWIREGIDKSIPRERLHDYGRKAARYVDSVSFVGEHARFGAEGAIEGGVAPELANAFQNYREAAAWLKPRLREGDLVFLQADHNRHLTRLFFQLLGEVKCRIDTCEQVQTCDFCPKFKAPELIRAADRLAI